MDETERVAFVLSEAAADAFQGFRMLREHGAFPIHGGWVKQSAKFLSAVEFCDRAMSLYEARAKAKAEEIRQLQKQMEKVMGNASWQR
ncbi:MAG: hypothetical protein ABIW76_14390 [Fibrobacteria bacterium]